MQKVANYTFTILPKSTIFSSDILVVEFPSFFDLSLLTEAVFSQGYIGTLSLSKTNNIIRIAALTSSNLQNKTLKFDLNKIINPFDLRTSVAITIKILTKDSFLRDLSTYSLNLVNGVITVNNFTCNNYQIGYKTACKLNFTIENKIKSDGQIQVLFPGNSWMLSQGGSNTQCTAVSLSSQLNSLFYCRFYTTSRSFIFSQFSSLSNASLAPFTATVSLEQSSVDIDNRIQLPWSVSNYSFTITSYTAENNTIDIGSFNLTTIKR